MSINKIIVTSCLLTLLLISQTVLAGNLPGAFTLSPQIGGYVFEGNQDNKLDSAVVYNIAAGYNFNKNIGTELGYSYIDTDNRYGESNEIHIGRLDLLYHFIPEKDLVPFGIAGLGISHADINDDDDIILEYGLGFKYFLSDNFALRAEVKHIQNFNYNDDDPNQSFYNNLSYTAGFTIQNNKW